MEKRTPGVLYHYCSLPTFYNITHDRTIWLSDISKSNDSLELKWIKGRCQYYILKAWVDYVKAAQKLEGHAEIDFESFDQLQKTLEDFTKFETQRCWALCLSGKKDDLGQWRGYADNGAGISIGFKSSYFKKIMKPGKATDITDHNTVVFEYICYDEKEVEKLFYNTCGISSITPQMSSAEVIDILRRAVIVSLLQAPLYKSNTFADEKEWRLVFSTDMSELMNGRTPVTGFSDFYPKHTIQYEYTMRGGELVSHIAFGDEKMHENISEIWIGPKCKLSSKELKLYLISTGYLKDYNDKTIEIHKSQISYR